MMLRRLAVREHFVSGAYLRVYLSNCLQILHTTPRGSRESSQFALKPSRPNQIQPTCPNTGSPQCWLAPVVLSVRDTLPTTPPFLPGAGSQ